MSKVADEEFYYKSPIYYMGNKYRLIKDFKKIFPKKIKRFFDIFGGSGVVGLNFIDRCDMLVYNEYSEWVFKLFNFYKDTSYANIDEKTKEFAKKYNLPINCSETAKTTMADYSETKNSFNDMVDFVMKYKYRKENLFFHHFIKMYSYCSMINYFPNGDTKIFKRPYPGHRIYKESNMLIKMSYINDSSSKIISTNKSFEWYMQKISTFNKDDFFYFDPPYLETKANYNDAWNEELDNKLLSFLDTLTTLGIKWAYSNIISNKDILNIKLIEWIKKNNYFEYKPNLNYSFGGNSGKIKETLITNYDPNKQPGKNIQLKLF